MSLLVNYYAVSTTERQRVIGTEAEKIRAKTIVRCYDRDCLVSQRGVTVTVIVLIGATNQAISHVRD